MITRKQIALVHVAKRKLGLADETYRTVLARAGVASAAELDGESFGLLMELFAQMGFESDTVRRNFGRGRAGMATPAQVNLMRDLWLDYTGGEGTDVALGKWLQRQFKVSALRFVDMATAPKVISTLKIMVAQRRAKIRESAGA